MKLKLILIGLICSIAVILTAQDSLKFTNVIRKSFDSEKITVANTAIGFTAATISPTCTL